jgi:taurine dioxygenase
MHIAPISGARFGAEVTGIDLTRQLDTAGRKALNQAFVDNVVLCIRQQSFDRPDDFLLAVKNLGEPMPPVTATYRLPGYDAVEELSNMAVDKRTGETTPLARGGSWHTDHSNLAVPPKATVLYAIELPRQGGNTEFTHMQMAYDGLAEELKVAISGRRAFHAYLSRRAPRKLLTRTREEQAGSDGCWQPLVRRHPETGRIGLYVNAMRCDAVEGYNQDDGDALLDQIYAHCDQAIYQYSHQWQPGDVLVWDNRSALHQASFDFDQSQRRYLHRIMLRGEQPVIAE